MLISLNRCQFDKNVNLPIFGERTLNENGDTIYHEIPQFSFIDQDSQRITNESMDGKMYIADFFFTSCPTICPKVKAQMLRIYQDFQSDTNVVLLSHTIDVKHDTIPKLRKYAAKLGVSGPKWHFVTGDEAEIYAIADDYWSIALKNPDSPGGFDHSGRLLLVDDKRHMRAFCDGTDPESVDKFMERIKQLQEEYKARAIQ